MLLVENSFVPVQHLPSCMCCAGLFSSFCWCGAFRLFSSWSKESRAVGSAHAPLHSPFSEHSFPGKSVFHTNDKGWLNITAKLITSHLFIHLFKHLISAKRILNAGFSSLYNPRHAYIPGLMLVLNELSIQLPHTSCSEWTQYLYYIAQFRNTNLSAVISPHPAE